MDLKNPPIDLVNEPMERRARGITIADLHNEQSPSLGKKLSLFSISFFAAALVTVSALLFKGTLIEPSIQLLIESASPSLAYETTSTGGRSAFLSQLLGKQARDLTQQVQFVADIIDDHTNDPRSRDLAYLIVAESFKQRYDPLFVAAVIKAESTFKLAAISGKGARGLMQIMPETGEYISRLVNVAWSGSHKLHEPEYNIRLGIAYLKYLDDMFSGNRERALIAYNWGPANLQQAIKEGRAAPGQCSDYARKIMSSHRKWRGDFKQELAKRAVEETPAVTVG